MRIAVLVLAAALSAAALSSPAAAQAGEGDAEPPAGDVAEALAEADPRAAALDAARREKLVSFVVGNVIFMLGHELGHALISEFKLPVLGREEDAADSFATLGLLLYGSERADQMLMETARGLWLAAERDKAKPPALYDEHSLDQQRAYQIICLMVGAAPHAFRTAAKRAKMPEERQESCKGDFEQAARSWYALLKDKSGSQPSEGASWLERLLGWTRPGRRAAPAPVDYAEAPKRLAAHRQAAMRAGVLELVSDFAHGNFAFPKPILFVAKSCGESNALWEAPQRRLTLCYELIAEYLDLALRAPE